MTAKKEEDKKPGFALGRENYKLMAIGFGVIILGFILMAGGRSEDPTVFSEDIFSFRRITLRSEERRVGKECRSRRAAFH